MREMRPGDETDFFDILVKNFILKISDHYVNRKVIFHINIFSNLGLTKDLDNA